MKSSVFRNMSSLSVGKPAMKSAPSATPGRRSRARCTGRERKPARMAALHALQDQVVAGLHRQMQMRHQPRLLGDEPPQSSSIAAGSSEESRSRANPGTSASSRRASCRATACPADPRHRRSDRRRSAPIRGSPDPTKARTCATTSPTGTERLGPRPKGMTQKVQRWSQPCCTCDERPGPGRRTRSTRCAAVSRTAHDVAAPATRVPAASSFRLRASPRCPARGRLRASRPSVRDRSARRSR